MKLICLESVIELIVLSTLIFPKMLQNAENALTGWWREGFEFSLKMDYPLGTKF